MKLRICIGTEPKTEIARKVLQHSILRNTSLEESLIEFHPMIGENWQNNPKYGVGTGFSLKRWTIPERFRYKGWAVYLDADQIVLGDIKELFESDDETDTSLWCTWQVDKFFPQEPKPNTSVMLINCEKAKEDWWPIKKVYDYLKGDVKRKRYIEIMHGLHLKHLPGKIENEWNHLNSYKEGYTKLLHYTLEHQQPWYNPKHPHCDLWEKELRLCLDEGYVEKEEIKLATEHFVKHSKGIRGMGMHSYWKKYIA